MNSSGNPAANDAPIRIGVSACLLGSQVRYDGGHKRNEFLVEVLGPLVEFVSVCPEVELGLGVPRETLRLERRGADERLIANKTGVDLTARMSRFADRRAAALRAEDLSGYVLKQDSPSCGLDRVRVYTPNGTPSRNGRGLFAQALMRRYPNLPVEEEGRLKDPRLRENFIERVFAYRRLRTLFAGRWTTGALVAFHLAHRLQLLAHSPRACSDLGRMVAHAGRVARAELRENYATVFMRALARPATRARHVNVLRYIAGHFRDRLDPESRRELIGVFEDYRKGRVPLIVPITLVRHYARLFAIGQLEGQVYLEPQPKELMLRNRV